MRLRLLAPTLALAPLLVAIEPAHADASPTVRRALERHALTLAKKGRADGVAELLDVLRELGHDAAAVAKLRSACDDALGKAKKRAPAMNDVAKALVQLADDLAGDLGALEGDARERRARLVLRLSGKNRAAHLALGHEELDGRFQPPGHADVLTRRAAIQEALRAARRMDVDIAESESSFPALTDAYGRSGYVLTAGGVALHGVTYPREKARRMLRIIVQARAVSWFLRRGTLAVPPKPTQPKTFVFVPEPERYHAAIRAAKEAGHLRETVAQAREMVGYYDQRGALVYRENTEAVLESYIVYHLLNYECREEYGGDPLGALGAGHLNWISLAYIGTWFPSLVGESARAAGAGADASRTSDRGAAVDVERDREQLVSRAGLAGTRSWLRFLVSRGEDPAWSTTGVAAGPIEYVVDEPLLKCTYVAEWLHETGRFDDFLRATVPDRNPGKAVDVVAPLVAPSYADFERRWREWLAADDGNVGLAERLTGDDGPRVTAEERKLLDHLDRIRLGVLRNGNDQYYVPLTLDAALSDGCRAHATYLTRNPVQLTQWPEAHEEFPDREAFTVEGSRAGLASVIYPGGLSPIEAVDGWLGTFYHRLPLLVPGVVRIGFGEVDGVTVLDATSMVRPWPAMTWVTYPPDSARGVPTAFVPELPNPVPDADQSLFGYPVTVQFVGFPKDLDVTLTLHEGASAKAPPVACHVSTPSAPSNPRLAPSNTWCLIPKTHLSPGTTYTARIEGIPDQPPYVWSFVTGR